jgi:hypothetical protein
MVQTRTKISALLISLTFLSTSPSVDAQTSDDVSQYQDNDATRYSSDPATFSARSNVSETSVFVPNGEYASTTTPSCKDDRSSTALDKSATCITLSVSGIPIDAHIIAVRTWARETNTATWFPCGLNAHGDCRIAWSAFPGRYYQRTEGDITILWKFYNWSDNRNRDAKLSVEWAK